MYNYTYTPVTVKVVCTILYSPCISKTLLAVKQLSSINSFNTGTGVDSFRYCMALGTLLSLENHNEFNR